MVAKQDSVFTKQKNILGSGVFRMVGRATRNNIFF